MTNVMNKETMSSLQIAEITGKTHSNVMRDVRSLLDQGVSQINFELAEYRDAQGKSRPCYHLTKKGCLILASGYDARLREKIINRWEALEIEKQQAKPLTHAELLLQNAQILVEQERRLNKVEERVLQIEAKTQTRPDYYSVVGYGVLHGISVNLKQASSIGRKAASICKKRGMETDTIPDPRFGIVKLYPSGVLDEVFNMSFIQKGDA